MKSHKLILPFASILILLLAGSCGRSDNEATKTVQVIQTSARFPQTVTLTQTMRRVTPTMAITSVPASETPTPIPVSSATVSLVPTLSIEETRGRMNDLLADNGGCQLPCLWGITPGKTTSQEAITILSPLSSLSDFNVFEPESGMIIINNGLPDDQIIHISISYLTYHNNANLITFDAEALKKLIAENSFEKIFDSEVFGKKLDFYMLHHLLSTQGRPSAVLLHTWGKVPPPPYGSGNFNVILLYPEQGIVVEYTTGMHIVGKNVEGCLANAHVEMSLLPEGDVAAFNKQLALSDWQWRIDYYKPIEEVTSMSVDDFYQAFRQHPEKCLETRTNLWPLPEE